MEAALSPAKQRGTKPRRAQSNCAMKSAFLLAAPLCLAPLALSQSAFAQAVTELPLRQVTLFSSGVGYFSRAGQIEDNATVNLTVRQGQLSDLLKSLVLFDEKGNVAPVSYSIQDTIGTRALGTDLNIPDSATPGAILKTFRGATVVLSLRGGQTVEGRVASVSTRPIPDDKGAVAVEVVNVLTATGLRSLDLSEVESFQFSDAALQTKFVAALEKSAGLLTTQLDDGARSVTLRFNGKGKRQARAGYLLEMPVWKTSYRLVLDDAKKPYLQGWAIVENPTDADWNGVQLNLVAGRPISFIQNLAIPIYVTRPVVQSDIPNASFTPQTFGESLGLNGISASIGRQKTAIAQGLLYDNALSPTDQMRGDSVNGPITVTGRVGPAGPSGPAGFAQARDEVAQIANISAITAQASGAGAGELFVYALDQPLTLPRGEAAMVPIVSRNVAGDALSIVNNDGNSGEQVAQNGFRLKNDSDLRLSGGPITVYSQGIYGGDARLDGLSPHDSKLIAYGIDLDLAVKRETDESRTQLLQIIVQDGVLRQRIQGFETQTYALKNKATKAKTVLIQQPDMGNWQLIDPNQRDEKSTEGDRFKVELKAGESRDYQIKWQQTYLETIAIGDFDFSNLDVYLRDKQIAPELKIKLETIAAKRARVADLQRQIAAQNKALEAIDKDQSRLRENMKVLDKTSALYQTYAKKLGAQEEKIAAIDAEIERLQTAQKTAQSELDDAIAGL